MHFQFSTIASAALALLAASPSLAGLTPAQIITSIHAITQKSQALQGSTNSINQLSGVLCVVGQGPLPQVIAGLYDIVNTGRYTTTEIQGSSLVPEPPATHVFNAFRDFVWVHQALLNILIGKTVTSSVVPLVSQPVATALRSIKGVVDELAFNLINLAVSQADNLASQQASLDGILTIAIDVYSGFQKAPDEL